MVSTVSPDDVLCAGIGTGESADPVRGGENWGCGMTCGRVVFIFIIIIEVL